MLFSSLPLSPLSRPCQVEQRITLILHSIAADAIHATLSARADVRYFAYFVELHYYAIDASSFFAEVIAAAAATWLIFRYADVTLIRLR